MNSSENKGFSKSIPYDNIKGDAYQSHLSKPVEHTTHQTSACISLSRKGLHSNDYLQDGAWKLKFLAEHFADFYFLKNQVYSVLCFFLGQLLQIIFLKIAILSQFSNLVA